MRSSRSLCILVSALLMTSFVSCGHEAEESSDTSIVYTNKQKIKYSGYITMPSGMDYVTLYQKPDKNSTKIAPVYLNDAVDVLKDQDDWCYVICDDYKGYIQKEYISLAEVDAASVTVSSTSSVTSTVTTSTETTSSVTTEVTTEAVTENTQSDTENPQDNDTAEDDHNDAQQPANDPQPYHEEHYVTPSVIEYPSISITLGIDPHPGDSEKYDLYMNATGKFTHYKYEAFRILPDGTETKLSEGQSSEARLLLAVHDSLLSSGATDRVKIVPYLNSTAGEPFTLDLAEPVKYW